MGNEVKKLGKWLDLAEKRDNRTKSFHKINKRGQGGCRKCNTVSF
ncbi:hypothetical protein [Anaeromicropila populeti]|nr:hypothetical protein [Anaeromicropila populeti]